MLFCFTGQYAPHALVAMRENPTASRVDAVTQLVEGAGGKLIAMYGTVADGPGAMVIFDADPVVASAIVGIAVAAGSVHNVKLTRLLSADEITDIRHKAKDVRGLYRPPGQ